MVQVQGCSAGFSVFIIRLVFFPLICYKYINPRGKSYRSTLYFFLLAFKLPQSSNRLKTPFPRTSNLLQLGLWPQQKWMETTTHLLPHSLLLFESLFLTVNTVLVSEKGIQGTLWATSREGILFGRYKHM